MIGQLFVYIYLVPLGPSDEYLQFPTARTMNLDASDFLPQIFFRIFEGKWMLLEIWMIIQFQVTAGAKCNKNRSGKNEDEKSYYSSITNVWCSNSKHVFFLIVSQILKSSSNVWIPSDKNSFPFERKWLQYFPIFFWHYHSVSKWLKMVKNVSSGKLNIWIFPKIENVNKQLTIR